jgi:uncharacterized protein YacL
MSLEFFVRIIGMILFGFGGLQVGASLAALAGGEPLVWSMVSSLIGALFGLILTPSITTRPFQAFYGMIRSMPLPQLLAGSLGLIAGLIVAALLAQPLSLVQGWPGRFLPIVFAVILGYIGATSLAQRRRDLFELFQGRLASISLGGEGYTPTRQILLDTSVIIDGRIADISTTGFIMGPMIVPHFVLNELQHIADSPDLMRRNRGRRGLDTLNRLQKEAVVPVTISDMDVPGIDTVDEKLVNLAKQLGSAILTNDFNLNRVAELQGVMVLNVNDLANSVKAIFLPGEEMTVQIIQEGKELGQGIGYLEDGTMIVVEGGRKYLNQTIPTMVTKVLQTSAGRMIFAKPNISSGR